MGGKRRRRSTRHNTDSNKTPQEHTTIVKESANIAAPPVATPVPILAPAPVTPATVPAPTPAPAATQTSTITAAAAAAVRTPQTAVGVKIIPKKKESQHKILPTKKKHPLVATTMKKPKLIVKTKAAEEKQETKEAKETKEPAKKRRFTEKRISLNLKPFQKTRKERKQMKEKIAATPIAAVRKMLITKGLLKPKANPPDEIARNMLHDFMMLHAIE